MRTFSCGHPRTPDNMIGVARQICRTCRSIRAKREWSETPDDQKHLEYRVRILPTQLDRARRRLAGLEAEAKRLGMTDLLA